MKISIITVCYNSSKTIERTFQSLQNQIYTNIEYIVIDGDSIDGTKKIIENYKEIISVYISEKDNGLYDAMNKGVSIATGDLVGILNSDDIFTNDRVLNQIADFHLNNTLDVSISNIIQFNKNEKVIRKYSAKNWNPKKLKLGFMPAHPAIFFKRELFDKYGGYRLDFNICADYELITRFFLKNKIQWKFLNITTHSMLIGGLSSSGLNSYHMVSKEIIKSLTLNKISFSRMVIHSRILWKIISFLTT